MKDPVILADSNITYERSAITDWIKNNNIVSNIFQVVSIITIEFSKNS